MSRMRTLSRHVPIEYEAENFALVQAEDYYRAERSLSHFIKAAWPVLEPGTPYLHNWHVDAISEHLEAVQLGQIRKLIINMPPRSMKSICVTVCFPVWLWIRDPKKRFICASYADTLATKHNIDRRLIIQSPWYQLVWGDRFKLAVDQNQKTKFQNDHRGQMFTTSVGGGTIGEGGDIIIIDDPLNPKMAASDLEREKANTWRDQSLSTRKNDKKTAAEIVVMQRLHEKDLTGHLLSKKDDPEPWVHLCLEAEATKRTIIIFPVSRQEKIREIGDILHPEREGPRELAQAKVDLGPAYEGQYQQDPRPSGCGFFPRTWWKRYVEMSLNVTSVRQYWDCANKPGITNDFSTCATWAKTPTGFFLLNIWREKVAFPQLEAAAMDLYAQYKPEKIMIEDAAAGVQLIQNLKAKTSLPVIPFQTKGRSKEVRAAGAQATVMAGNCYLPDHRPWVEMFISEHEKFPNVEHDDQVDTTSMMIEDFRTSVTTPRMRSL